MLPTIHIHGVFWLDVGVKVPKIELYQQLCFSICSVGLAQPLPRIRLKIENHDHFFEQN